MQFARDAYGGSNTECQFWNFTADCTGQAFMQLLHTLIMYCACGVLGAVHNICSGMLLCINGRGGNSYFMECLFSLIVYLHLQLPICI